MTREQIEKERHEIYMDQLEDAKTVKELPKKITASVVINLFQNLASFKDKKIPKEKLEKFVKEILKDDYYVTYGFINEGLTKILKENYPDKTDDEIIKKIDEVSASERLENILCEGYDYYLKYLELDYKEKTKEHKDRMIKIRATRDIKELPKIGIGDINARIVKDLYEPFNKTTLKVEYTGPIAKALLEGKDFNDKTILNAIDYLCEKKEMNEEYNDKNIDYKFYKIRSLLGDDYELTYMVEEIKAKEEQTLKIYKLDHEDIMDNIKDATRISEMPTNLSISRITSYLSGNSMVYPKGKVIPSGDFLNVAQLLLSGKKMSDTEIQKELMKIIDKNYEELSIRVDAYRLLNKKLSKLPKLDYYVEEVKYGMKRQQEFISRGSSNVNIYFIPNPKSPIDGGRFYNCYINRASNLNLEEVLPLDLESIVPPNMDIDAVEWYVREKADPTFKAAGGIILNKDESIGGVNVFRPNDGKVGITKEEKSRYEKLEELSKKLKEVTDRSKKAKEEYMKAQAVIDEQIETIQAAMNVLIEEDEKVLKKEWKEEQ